MVNIVPMPPVREEKSESENKSDTPQLKMDFFSEKSGLQFFVRKISLKFGLKWIPIELFAAITMVPLIYFKLFLMMRYDCSKIFKHLRKLNITVDFIMETLATSVIKFVYCSHEHIVYYFLEVLFPFFGY